MRSKKPGTRADHEAVELRSRLRLQFWGAIVVCVALISWSGRGFSLERTKTVIKPDLGLQELRIEPGTAFIYGVGNTHTLLFTGRFADGSERDVTRQVSVQLDAPAIIGQLEPGVFQSRREGIVKLRGTLGGRQAESVIVVQPKRTAQISFVSDVAPIFSKFGCNNTNCHGAKNGQSGFKLSLFGYDPEADYRAVVQDSDGRRIDVKEPEKSLLLQKPTFQKTHGGGQLLSTDRIDYQTMLDWIRTGVNKGGSDGPRLAGLAVMPKGLCLLKGLGSQQQIVALGHYLDGSREDMTQKVQYTSGNKNIAEVTEQGRILAKGYGETTIMIRTLGHVASVRVGVAREAAIPKISQRPANFIDESVFKKLSLMGIEISDPANDEEFLRRVYLDVIGILPTAEETCDFLEDSSPAKRARLIDQVLERPEYADFWALKWDDLFANSLLGVGEGGVYLQEWLRRAFAANKPYDQLVREILTSRGSTWDGTSVFFSRDPEDLTTVTAQAFLGISLECARCHDHPSEKWKREDFVNFTSFFSQLTGKEMRPPPVEKIRTLDFALEYRHPETKQVVKPRLLDGTEPVIRPLDDRRKILAGWITSPGNPWFARATVNRIWRQFMGRGLVEPAGDFRVTNPPTNEALLDRLAGDLIGHKFDLKHIMRIILNSKTYQLSSITKPGNRDDEINYSHYYLRRLTAEQLLDAIVQVTGVPEKFPGYYPGTRAVNLTDPGIPSRFLDMYDRPQRDAAKCEREERISLGQAMHMLVGDTVNEKIRSEKGSLARLIKGKRTDHEIVEYFYLSALSRYPKLEVKESCLQVIRRGATREKGLQNMVWALLNSNQFLYNH
ncbi:MAG: DUF1549 and DUF1553 domain-containing protein [Acidobacteria bacterium]|nr:DUF1549 and DUF1553 domain-containing protein [Acidobacteriota bacterium]MCI0723549.1 DUF1549 and DUF1553 domain-containing protein [Acidobacteriota bacterium]